MTRIEKLVAELTADPLDRGLAAMTAEQVVANLNTVDRARNRVLDSSELSEWAMGGPMMRIKRAIDADTAPDAVLSVAWGAWRMLERENSTFDPSNAGHVGMVDALVSASILTAQDKTNLLALASESISRAAEIGVTRLRIGTVEDARRKMA